MVSQEPRIFRSPRTCGQPPKDLAIGPVRYVACMEPKPCPDDPPSKPPLYVVEGLTPLQPNVAQRKAHAVAELLRTKSLTEAFGEHGEFEVRTTIETRQTWRYRCRVFRYGKEIRRGFFPLDVDRTRDMRKEPRITEEMRLAFADEAVEGHFALAAAVREYALMAAIYTEPQSRRRRLRGVAAIVLISAALLAAYCFWQARDQGTAQPLQAKPLARVVRWKQDQAFFQHPAGQPFAFFLPKLERRPAAGPVEIRLEPSSYRPRWMEFDPKALLLSGVAPIIEYDQGYHLVFEARAEDGGASRLDVYVNITAEADPPPPSSPEVSRPAASDPSPAKDCLLKILKGEPC
jgi:hypothetical protein